MPRRNLLILVLVMLVAVLCRERIQPPSVRVLASAMSKIEDCALNPVGEKRLFEGAMTGMMDQLDKNSKYFSPARLKEFREDVDLQFAGVGLEIGIDPKTKELKVLSPVVNSPAAKAGIVAGDRIVRIDKTDTQGMSLADASVLLRGRKNTPVTLSVLHESQRRPQDVTIVREQVQADSVRGDVRKPDGSWDFFLDGRDRIGYLRITTFTDNTANELRQALAWMSEQGLRGLVLDLRDNPGGYLDAAVSVCELFIESGEIVSTRGRKGVIVETYSADDGAPFTDFPVAVLVNQQTASAAEIVAACLQDNHRAVIVGDRTYGKGTVQDLIDLEPGCGAMKLTTKSYWRPSGKNIQRPPGHSANGDWGVSPDKGFKVELSEDEIDDWREWRVRRDVHQTPDASFNGGKPFVDRPLRCAIEYIERQVAKPKANKQP
jgi:carboxyl-terminal processing protease